MVLKTKILVPATLAVLLTVFLCSSLFSAVMGDEKEEVVKSKKAWIGIYMQDLNDDLVEAFNLSIEKGVLINGVIEDSPAEIAGLKEGDVIIRFDNDVIDDITDLRKVMKTKSPSDKATIVVVRDEAKKDFSLVLGEPQEKSYSYKTTITAPRAKAYTKARDYYANQEEHGYLGVFLEDLNNQLAEYFEVEEGVLITKVEEDSPAEKAGLKAGDVIVKIDDGEISSSDDVTKVVARHEKGDKVDVTVIRKGVKMNYLAELDERKMDVSWYGLNSGDNNVFRFYGPGDIDAMDFDFEFDPEELELELEGLNSELQEEMEALKEEMRELKEELNELKDELK